MCSFSNLTIIGDLTSYQICQMGRNLKSQLLLGSQFWVLLLHALPALHFCPVDSWDPHNCLSYLDFCLELKFNGARTQQNLHPHPSHFSSGIEQKPRLPCAEIQAHIWSRWPQIIWATQRAESQSSVLICELWKQDQRKAQDLFPD